MPTILQRRLAKNIVKAVKSKDKISGVQILKNSGYSDITSETKQTEIIANEGTQEALKEYGFTEENAKKVLAGILNTPMVSEMITPDNQIRAAQEIFKVLGSYAPEKRVNVNIPIPIYGGKSTKNKRHDSNTEDIQVTEED